MDTGQIISCLQEIRKLGMKAGLAINPETEVEALVDFKDFADQFLLLSVHPGFQGRHFLPKTIDRVKQLRSLVPHAILEVDGGINSENIGQLADAGGAEHRIEGKF